MRRLYAHVPTNPVTNEPEHYRRRTEQELLDYDADMIDIAQMAAEQAANQPAPAVDPHRRAYVRSDVNYPEPGLEPEPSVWDLALYTSKFDHFGDEIPCFRPIETLTIQQLQQVHERFPDIVDDELWSRQPVSGFSAYGSYLIVRMAKTTVLNDQHLRQHMLERWE